MTLQTRISALANTIAGDIKTITGSVGNLASLSTTAKGNLVAALNELKGAIDAFDLTGLINDTTPGTSNTYSSTKINLQISAAIASLVNSSPAALDTLKELSDALGGDANFAATISTALGERVSVNSQTFTAPQQTQARTNIGAASATALSTLDSTVTGLVTNLGNIDTDFSAQYVATRDA